MYHQRTLLLFSGIGWAPEFIHKKTEKNNTLVMGKNTEEHGH
jgi:hypothetical protein